ncbi:nucleotidyltransferase family protein [Priestia sp. SB1]|uniref:nucleotidyltransferase domain-containing protein n=1 Tax=Priestia sp. SB1 TaxID=3132359 RepID=UPI00316F9223
MNKKFKPDLKPLSHELNFLLELLKEKKGLTINQNEHDHLKDIDWRIFLQLVEHHRCYPLIYKKLKGFDGRLIPPYVMQTLNREYKKNTIKMLQLSGEMEQVDKVFNQNNIPLLFLKGPALAYELFGDISLRMSKDLDILVLEKDIEKTEKILLNLGYEKEEIPVVFNEIKLRRHHIAYYHPQKRVQIEMHWRLHHRSIEGANFEELWHRKRESLLTNHPLPFMGREDLLLYLISHGSRHGWFRLRWLKDIDQIVINDDINYEHFSLLTRRYKQERLVGQAFQLANLLLNTPINSHVKEFVETRQAKILAEKALPYIREMVQLHSNVQSRPSQLDKSFKRYLFSLKSKRKKIEYITIMFYPSVADERTLKLPKCINFLYFPLRPFLFILRKIRKTELF